MLSYNNSIRYLDLVTSRAARYAESLPVPPPDPQLAGLRLDEDLVAQAALIRAAILD